MNLLDC
jgi:hypothetical protein